MKVPLSANYTEKRVPMRIPLICPRTPFPTVLGLEKFDYIKIGHIKTPEEDGEVKENETEGKEEEGRGEHREPQGQAIAPHRIASLFPGFVLSSPSRSPEQRK